MGFIKLKADALFTGLELLSDDQVLICKENGTFENIVSTAEAGEGVQHLNGILSPGFINAHCHLELSHLKNKIPKGTGLVDFVFRIITERHYDENDILEYISLAEKEMYDGGIVAVGDICNNLLTLNQKRKRNIAYYNFIEVSGWNPDVAILRFDKSKTYYEEFIKYFTHTSMVPHAPYSVSDPLWEKLQYSFADKIVSIHNQETAGENEFFKEGKGDLRRMYEMMKIDTSFFIPSKISSLKTYFRKLSAAKKLLLVHNTYTSQEDLDHIKKYVPQMQQIFICICINANLYIEKQVPPVNLFRKNNVDIVLGTDSLASNDQLSILEEMKTISTYFPNIPLSELLTYATINGARALDMEDTHGSFEAGKKPGVVLINNYENGMIQKTSTAKRII